MGHQYVVVTLAKLDMETSGTHLLLGRGRKLLLSRESLKRELSPVTRHWRINEGGSLCGWSPAAAQMSWVPTAPVPSPGWWAMSGH